MSVQAADAIIPTFGFERETVMVYELKRGDRFMVEGSDTIWEFARMDGMYCYAREESGRLLNWSGPVIRVL